ncbi:MAG TPA: cupin domain-containing protein [Verrucomicrobiae bacterium]|nr:cupin domain-containing protein [Verrucomicrobiae bacterium]
MKDSEGPSQVNRRKFLAAGSTAVAAAFVAQADGQSLESLNAAHHDRSSSDPGPENTPLRDANPNTFDPPITDHGEAPTFWNTFSTARRRIQEGGWSRQVTVEDFPISTAIAGVNMRLVAGGIRELHRHAASEWALMLNGNARITAIDNEGHGYVKDVGKNDLWFFPTGIPHSIQGLGPGGCEFLLVFDDAHFSEGNTTLILDWLRHTPKEVLAKNWGLDENSIEGIYQVPPDGRYIFQAPPPPKLEDDSKAISDSGPLSKVAFDFAMHSIAPTISSKSGEVRIIDSRNFPVATTIAAAYVVVHPGGLRELHWHPNADEWQYYVQGRGRMTVFFNGGKARTADFKPGDVGCVPKTMGHYVENTGETDLIFLEMFKANRFEDLSLSEWVTHIPPELVMEHLNLSREALAKISREKTAILPAWKLLIAV